MSEARPTGKIHLRRRSDAYWRVTFDLPPLFGPANIPQLEEVVSSLETDERVKVVVFDRAVDGFFLIHYDFLAKLEESTKFPPGPTGLQPLPDLLVRVSRAPVVSIALIRGRATGLGSELALASDMRFASRERAVLSQWEVGAGLVPGGGPMARLPRLIGRGRALEVLLGADDIDGDLAELYGYVNRSLPDTELDDFVDRLADFDAHLDPHARAILDDALGWVIVGGPDTVRRGLDDFIRRTGADELMVTANIFDHTKRSFEIVAEVHGAMKASRTQVAADQEFAATNYRLGQRLAIKAA